MHDRLAWNIYCCQWVVITTSKITHNRYWVSFHLLMETSFWEILPKKKKKTTRIVVYTKIQNYLREKIGICYNKIAFLEKALQGFLVSLGKGVFAWFWVCLFSARNKKANQKFHNASQNFLFPCISHHNDIFLTVALCCPSFCTKFWVTFLDRHKVLTEISI